MSGYEFSREPVTVAPVHTNNRIIKTAIPAPGTVNLLEKLDKFESRSMHGQLPIVWHRAEGHSVFDRVGNKWIDFTSMIFVANVGHGNEAVIKKVKSVLDTPMLGCYAYPNEIRATYLEKLVRFAGPNFEKAFLLSAGTEATEAAFKLMKMHGKKLGKKKNVIIAISGNWHGRTLAAQMLSDNASQKSWVTHEQNDVWHIDFPYPWDISEEQSKDFLLSNLELLSKKDISLKNDVTGFMLETFQGWGAIFYPKSFVKKLREICDENEILLTFDEMQAGFGRTGELFGYMNYDVQPDLLACGKGASSSLPLAVVLGSKEVMDLPGIGSMSSTHSANPLVCAAGLANMQALIEDGLIENSKKLGVLCHTALNNLKDTYSSYISSVQGTGLLAAVIFNDAEGKALSELCDLIAEKCLQTGLLVVHTGRESIKLAPPLMITEEAMMEGVNTFAQAIEDSIKEKYGA